MVPRVDIALQSGQTETPLADRESSGFMEPAALGEGWAPSLGRKPSIYTGIQQTGDENGYPPGRYHAVLGRYPTPLADFWLAGV